MAASADPKPLVSPASEGVAPNAATSTSERAAASARRWLETAGWMVFLLWCAIPFSPSGVDSDFWGHVQYGRDTLAHGLARTATYTYTAENFPWINHENLCEIVFAWFVDGPGVSSLLITKCLMGLTILGLAAFRARRQGVSQAVFCVLGAVAAWNLSYYWGVRPHIFSFFFFALLVLWTERVLTPWRVWSSQWLDRETAARGGRAPGLAGAGGPPSSAIATEGLPPLSSLHRLWLVPLGLIVWTNTHGGFLAGLAVWSWLCGGQALEMALRVIRSGRPESERRRTLVALRGPLGYLAVLVVAGWAATLVNPYGAELHRWLAYDVGTPRPEIAEWRPLDWNSPNSVKTWALVGLGVLSLAGWGMSERRVIDWTRGSVTGVVLLQAMMHQRHLPFFVILMLVWSPAGLQCLWQHAWEALTADLPRERARRGLTPAACYVLAGVLAVAGGPFAVQLSGRFGMIPVRRDDYPVAAVEYMSKQGLTGRLIVSGHWAQYVLSTLGARTRREPGISVAFDGRHRTCYPQEVLDMQFDFFAGDGGPDERYRSPESPPFDPRRILQEGQPDLILVGNHHTLALQTILREGRDWTLLYQDSLAQIWGRTSIFHDEDSPRYLARDSRQITGERQEGQTAWPADPWDAGQRTWPVRSVRSAAGPTTPSRAPRTREARPARVRNSHD